MQNLVSATLIATSSDTTAAAVIAAAVTLRIEAVLSLDGVPYFNSEASNRLVAHFRT